LKPADFVRVAGEKPSLDTLSDYAANIRCSVVLFQVTVYLAAVQMGNKPLSKDDGYLNTNVISADDMVWKTSTQRVDEASKKYIIAHCSDCE
jgi:hypothetical protein